MLNRLKQKPLLTALLIVLLYALWFIIPPLFTAMDPNAKGTVGIEGALKMLQSELITGSVLILFLSILAWWKKIGFRKMKQGSFKFMLPMIIISLLILNLSWVFESTESWFLGFQDIEQLLLLLLTMLMLGFVEEGIFRGVLFYGLSTKLTPFYTVLISAFIFGLFHFANLFTGADAVATSYQALHAFAMGFLYASLRLRMGAIWPLMLLHGLWDFSLFVMQTTMHSGEEATGDIPLSAGLMIGAPALLYGLFVFWRWSKTQSQNSLTQQKS